MSTPPPLPPPGPQPSTPSSSAHGSAPGSWGSSGSEGYYPQEAYYAAGWDAPVPSSASAVPPPPRRWPLVLGLVAVAVVVLAIALTSLRTWADQQPLGEINGSLSAHTRQLTTGHCLETLPADGTLGRVTVVPCTEPHEAEVIAVHRYAQEEWPGRTSLERESAAMCEMDTRQQEAGVRPVVWTPSEAAWDDGERRALCLAWAEGGGVTGSWTTGDAVVP